MGANDEDIRKRIIETDQLMDHVVSGLTESDDHRVQLAAVRCLHSLSRSVQQLRTTFQARVFHSLIEFRQIIKPKVNRFGMSAGSFGVEAVDEIVAKRRRGHLGGGVVDAVQFIIRIFTI